jgi:hypothetical protein
MLAQIAFASVLNALGLFGASKIMSVSLSLIQAFIVAATVETISYALTGPHDSFSAIAMVSVLLVYIASLKIFTGESIFGIIKLSILSLIIQYAVVASVVKIIFPISVSI